LSFGHAIFLLVAAMIAGTLNSIAGGGSFVSFPALLFLRVPSIEANSTNTVALWPGLAASSLAYLRRLDVPRRLLIPLLATSVLGGLGGALLLVKTPPHTFLHLVPWLLLGGTLLFMFGNQIRRLAGKTAHAEEWRNVSWPAVASMSLLELLVGIYGGYFGAGIGFITLGMLAALGMRDLHAMNALRTLLAAVINAAAVTTFVAAGAVLWPQFAVMVVGALSGGWFGARYAQRADPKKMRYLIIAVGFSMSAYFFVTTR
jgi:uncharacterized protein